MSKNIENRRAFFKKIAQTALAVPFLAVAAKEAVAETQVGPSASCPGGCTAMCGGCVGTCTYFRQGQCRRSSQAGGGGGNGGGGCRGTCMTSCMTSCIASCSVSCSTGCKAGCLGMCGGTCTIAGSVGPRA